MPVTTYMRPGEMMSLYEDMDTELKELSQEIEKLTGDRYVVRRTVVRTRKSIWWNPWSKVVEVDYFTILISINDVEAQCINLMTGMGGGYSREEAGAFLIGVQAEAWKHRIPETRWQCGCGNSPGKAHKKCPVCDRPQKS